MRINDQIQGAKLLPTRTGAEQVDRKAVPSRDYSDRHIFLLSAVECLKTLAGMENSLGADEESEKTSSLWCQKKALRDSFKAAASRLF